ncbi:hypothetical protein T484DRAFT_1955224, partial [Baffinella frigidus]
MRALAPDRACASVTPSSCTHDEQSSFCAQLLAGLDLQWADVWGHRFSAAPNPEQHHRPRSRRPVEPAHLPRRAPTRPGSQTSRAAFPSR